MAEPNVFEMVFGRRAVGGGEHLPEVDPLGHGVLRAVAGRQAQHPRVTRRETQGDMELSARILPLAVGQQDFAFVHQAKGTLRLDAAVNGAQ
jgi:hypothetical protein